MSLRSAKESANLVSKKMLIGAFHRYQMKCKSVSKKSPRYIFAAQKRKSKEEKYVQDLFDSLTLGERAYLAFAVAANNQLKTEKGSPEAISLLEKGLLIRVPSATGYPEIDRFVIPERYRNECYIRFAGKKDSLMDELIAQDKHGKNK